MERRQLLQLGLGLGAAALLPGGLARASTRMLLGQAGERRPCLVLVQLTGGNDGLDTVVPYADDHYGRARRTTALGKADVLDLDGHVGLHGKLTRLGAEWSEGRLGIVQGVGYPQPNRSHFKSFEIWHTGRAEGRTSGPGWVGRLAQSLHGDRAHPNRLVHIGGQVPYSLHSTAHPPVAFANPRGYRLAGQSGELAPTMDAEPSAHEGCEDLPRGARARLEALRAVMRDAQASSAEVRAAVAQHKTGVVYPNTDFAVALSTAAALIAANLGAEVISVELGGFDTHTELRRRHDTLMEQLDGGLGAFLEELRGLDAARDTLVVVYSEFGRRVAENGARGTDHGTAGPLFVAGPRAAGGLYGRHPSLSELDEGDLVHTTDFRAVFGSAAKGLFGADPSQIFDGRYDTLPIVREA